jgi:carbon-monoxide dehydrogenase large subunit
VLPLVPGDKLAVEQQLRSASHVTSVELVNNRLVGAAIEPRAVLAVPAGDGLILYSSTQVPHHIGGSSPSSSAWRRMQFGHCAGCRRRVRLQGKALPEEVVLAGLPGVCSGQSNGSRAGARASFSTTRAAIISPAPISLVDAEGRFQALRVETVANLGAYVSTFGAAIPSAIYSSLLAGVYRTPAVLVECTGVFTNTVPTDAYRGAGRPEACYVLERLADQAARELGIDRAEIRRRNLIPAQAMPYKTPIGPTYDCGDFPKVFSRALVLADYQGFGTRREAAAARECCAVSASRATWNHRAWRRRGSRDNSARVAGFFESARIRVNPDGSLTAMLGTHNHGQGHATSLAQILASKFGIPHDQIQIVEGDTDLVPFGTGTFGSRSIAVGGSALEQAAVKVIAKGRRIASHLLEAGSHDVTFADGFYFGCRHEQEDVLRGRGARGSHSA